MNCLNCHVPNAPEAKFCKNCGANLVTPEVQARTDHQAIKSLLIIIGVDYLLSIIMFLIQKLVIPFTSGNGDYSQMDVVYKIYGWGSDVLTLAIMLYFLITVKNQTVKNALVVFIIIRFITMIGYRLTPFLM